MIEILKNLDISSLVSQNVCRHCCKEFKKSCYCRGDYFKLHTEFTKTWKKFCYANYNGRSYLREPADVYLCKMRELYFAVGFKFDDLDDLEKALEMVGAWDVMRYSSERDFFLRVECRKMKISKF